MEAILRAIVVTLALIPPAMAAGDPGSEESSLLVTLFLSFGAMIIVFQLIPSLILFCSMLKGLFTKPAKEVSLPAGGNGEDQP
jgi:hypothetical protein